MIYTAIGFVFIVIVGILLSNLLTKQSVDKICTSNNGQWFEEFSECEYISEELCSNMGGVFNECSSACRHTESQICTMQCVPVCSLI